MSRVRYLYRVEDVQYVHVYTSVRSRTLNSIKFVFPHTSIRTLPQSQFKPHYTRVQVGEGRGGGRRRRWIVKIKIQFTANAHAIIFCQLYRRGCRFCWYGRRSQPHIRIKCISIKTTQLLYITLYLCLCMSMLKCVCFVPTISFARAVSYSYTYSNMYV